MSKQCALKTIRLSKLLDEPVKNGYSPVCVDEPTSRKILGLGALTGSGLNLNEFKWVPENDKKVDKFLLKNNDFLVSRSNTVDKVGRAALFKSTSKNFYYPDLMMKFRVDEEMILPNFLELYLQSDFARKHFMCRASGTSQSMVKITKAAVESLDIPFFNLNEQKKIFNIIGLWTDAIRKTEALIAAKEGRFEWLHYRLFTNNKQNIKKLSAFCTIKKHKKITSADGLKPLTVKLHCKGIESNNRDVQIKLTSKGRPYFQRFTGDFLIGRQNFHNGGFGIVPKKLDGFIASNAITTVSIDSSRLNQEYLFYYFSRKSYYERIGHVMDGTGQKELSDKQILGLSIYVPNLVKQIEIISILNAAKQEINVLKQLSEKYQIQKRGLMQKLLTGEWRVDSRLRGNDEGERGNDEGERGNDEGRENDFSTPSSPRRRGSRKVRIIDDR